MPSILNPIRVKALLYKEMLQILRDPSSIALAFIMPIILLLLFGYGISLDPKQLPVAFVIENPSPQASDFLARFVISDYFKPIPLTSWKEAQEMMRAREVDAIIRLRSDFTRKLQTGGTAPIQVIVNGVDSNRANQIKGYVQGAWQRWMVSVRPNAMLLAEERAMGLVQVQQRVWFNSELRSQNFLVPGLMAMIMTLIGTLLTALVMAREWERGTMEALLVTPVSRLEIIIGKLVPYFILGMGGLALCMVMALFLFDVPFRGSLWVLLLLGSLFMAAALGLGLFISSLVRNQFVAAQSAILAAFLPAFFLSNFIFELASAPKVIRIISHVVPAKYFVAIVQSLFLAGNVHSVLWPNGLSLAAMAGVFMFLAFKKTRKSLE